MITMASVRRLAAATGGASAIEFAFVAGISHPASDAWRLRFRHRPV